MFCYMITSYKTKNSYTYPDKAYSNPKILLQQSTMVFLRSKLQYIYYTFCHSIQREFYNPFHQLMAVVMCMSSVLIVIPSHKSGCMMPMRDVREKEKEKRRG